MDKKILTPLRSLLTWKSLGSCGKDEERQGGGDNRAGNRGPRDDSEGQHRGLPAG